MVYEAFQPKRFNIILAVLCASLSMLGLAALGVIGNEKEPHLLIGGGILILTLGAAAEFVRRALDKRPMLRVDERGIYSRRFSPQTVPWDQITGARVNRLKNQRVLSLDLVDPKAYPAANPFTRLTAPINRATGFGSMGINPTFLTGGINGLVNAVRHYRPDLFAG